MGSCLSGFRPFWRINIVVVVDKLVVAYFRWTILYRVPLSNMVVSILISVATPKRPCASYFNQSRGTCR